MTAGKGRTAPDPRTCPICGKPASAAARPFCSPRCADVDLHRWLSGAYVIPDGTEPEDTGSSGGTAEAVPGRPAFEPGGSEE